MHINDLPNIINIQEGSKFVCRKTLIYINKGKAYGRQGKAPETVKFQHSRLLESKYETLWVTITQSARSGHLISNNY